MGFIALYTLAFISTSLLFLAPLLVTLALSVSGTFLVQLFTGNRLAMS